MKNLRLKNIAVISAFVVGHLLLTNAVATTYYSESTRVVTGTFFVNLTTPIPDSVSTVYLSFNASNISGGVGSWWYVIDGQNRSSVPDMITDQPLGSSNSLTVTFTGTGDAIDFGFNPRNATFTMTNLIICDSLTECPTSSGSLIDLSPNAYALRSVYNIQSAALNAGLSYDCNVFDKQGICLSTGGRYSTTNSPQATTTSGLLIGSYKYDKNIRLGAWVDQNLSTQNADGIKLSNNAPLFGVFGVWAERDDGLGYEVKVSAGYGDKDVTVTRTSTNEGSSKINSRGLQTVSSYGIALDSDWIAAPYVGVKYVSLKRGAYTESGSDGLTYDNLRQESTSVIAGVKFTGKIDPQTFTVLSAGVEQDLSNNIGEYSAGSSNTTAFNSNVQKTRPVVSAGVYYDIDKTQRLGLNAIHRQEAFQSTATTSALATYTVGF
jgi:hypothetical protein